MAEKNLIWAQTSDGTIAMNGRIPWHQKADMHFFKQATIHQATLMGRHTMASFNGRPLPERLNLVLTHDRSLVVPSGFQKVYSVQEAEEIADQAGVKLQIIGGKPIYESFLNQADALYVTYLDSGFAGDVKMPAVDTTIWHPEEIDSGTVDAENDYDWRLVKYTR